MIISIETIDGKACTVVWRKGDPEFMCWDEADFIGGNDAADTVIGYNRDGDVLYIALSALPRHPKPEDAQLLYRYMADGIKPEFKWRNGRGLFVGASIVNIAGSKNSPVWLVETPRHITRLFSEFPNTEGWEITHATFNGERVDVAIEG